MHYLCEHISVVTQHQVLFDATVTENIMLGSTLTSLKVPNAGRAAHVYGWTMGQEREHDMMLGKSAALILGNQA
jgi:ABC-type transport system involved in cytochrome bd biosynthesis fused ATPase/permease subunit